MQKRNDNLLFWLKQPNGMLKDEKTISSIIEHSESLDTLYRKGITITSIYKFSPLEEETAQLIGEIFFKDHRVIEDIKKSINENKIVGRIRVRGELFHKTLQLLKLLVKLNVVENDFAYERHLPTAKGEKPKLELITYKKIKKLVQYKKRQHVQICFSLTDNKAYRDFVVGHWFNAFAYSIIREHLKRNRFDFEIYTRVNYQAPPDVFGAYGDFDILALVNNKILMVECKFGRIYEKSIHDMRKVIDKSDGLKAVFDVTSRKFDYLSILVYNKKVVKSDFLSKTFSKSDFHLIDIGDLRRTIVEVFTDKPKAIKKEVPQVQKNKSKSQSMSTALVPMVTEQKPKKSLFHRLVMQIRAIFA